MDAPETMARPDMPVQAAPSGPADMAGQGVEPVVAIVIPCYGYASFMPEFMDGLLAQQGGVPFRCVIVDDCDPDPMMRDTARTFAAAYPELIHYLRPRRNGGLSSARNSGVEYAMAHWPGLEMVMFPDADDRMCRDYVANSYAAFTTAAAAARARGDRLGWVFEHPRMFGVAGYMPRITRHSVLWNLVGATQMPSSALSIEMFRDGLRYNETLKWAGEDWEFSVAALAAGFVAEFCDRQGFLWRRRPGSMSASYAANLAREHNRTFIRLANKPLFSRDAIVNRLVRENPQFAVSGPDGLFLAAAPSDVAAAFAGQTGQISLTDLARQLQNSENTPADPLPQTFFFAPYALPEALEQSGLLAWFTLLSDFYAGSDFVVCHRFCPAAPGTPGPVLSSARFGRPAQTDVTAVSRDRLLQISTRGLAHATFITLEWDVPGLAAGRRETGALMALEKAAQLLGKAGYTLQCPVRNGRNSWQPLNLDWQKLPGFLLGAEGIFAEPAHAGRHLCVCPAEETGALLDAAAAAGIGQVDIMTVSRAGPAAEARLAEAVRQGQVGAVFPANSALADAGPSQQFWREVPMTRVLASYGAVSFWRTMTFAGKLALLKTSGARREIIFRDAEDVGLVLGSVSSAFKCYDSYRVLSDPGGTGAATLAAYGVPGEVVRTGLWPNATH